MSNAECNCAHCRAWRKREENTLVELNALAETLEDVCRLRDDLIEQIAELRNEAEGMRDELAALWKQEPVAWMRGDMAKTNEQIQDVADFGLLLTQNGWEPLYAAPVPPAVKESLTTDAPVPAKVPDGAAIAAEYLAAKRVIDSGPPPERFINGSYAPPRPWAMTDTAVMRLNAATAALMQLAAAAQEGKP